MAKNIHLQSENGRRLGAGAWACGVAWTMYGVHDLLGGLFSRCIFFAFSDFGVSIYLGPGPIGEF